MTVKINDKTVTLPEGATLADAIAEVGVNTNGIATALNGTVVPAQRRADTAMHDGDSVIIIKAFYGG